MMRKLIYLMNVSLDGFFEKPDGKFDFTRPDEEVHRFHQDQARDMSAFLYGRRLYETMKVWQTMDADPSLPAFMLDFARIWKSKPKIVFSTTLAEVGEGCRLVRGDAATEVARLKQEPGGDLSVGGPTLAATLAKAGLIDEYRLVVYPILVGGGKSYFPALERPVPLRLIETRQFAGGGMYLRYERA
jgi:dihydrofolate reductase